MVQNDFIKISELKDYLYQLNKTLSKEDRQKLVRVEFYRNSKTSEEIINQIEEILNDYGYATIDIKGSELKDNKNTIEKSESPETGFVEIKNTWHFFVIKKNKKYYYNLEGFETDNSGEIISKTRVNASDVIPNSYITKVYKDGKVVVNFKDNWNEAQKKENLNTAITAKGISQDGATKEQISEYNAIASKYSDMNTAKQIKKSEIDRMNYLYNLMTDKQKKSVTNYPELPPMPPAPPKVKKGETSNIPPLPLAPASPKVKKGETSNIPPPPPPFHKGEVSKSLESAYNSWVKTLKNADGSYNIITKEEYRYSVVFMKI